MDKRRAKVTLSTRAVILTSIVNVFLAVNSNLEVVKGQTKGFRSSSVCGGREQKQWGSALIIGEETQTSQNSSVVNPRPGRWLADDQVLKEPW